MSRISEKAQISPFMIFYLTHSIQFGVGVLGFQRIIAKEAGNDGWMVVILSGIIAHLSFWMIVTMLKRSKGKNIVDLHKEYLGKWLGHAFSLLITGYFMFLGLTVLITYTEIVEVWVFPDLNVWVFTFLFYLLVYYILSGGFRIVAGIAFLGVILPAYLIFTFIFPLKYAHYYNLLPIFHHSPMELFGGMYKMSLSLLGFESIFFYYPFIKNPEKSAKWGHFGIAVTTFVYLLIAVVSIIYFSEEQIQKNIWATLTLWKVVEMPFVERFEYIGIANWNLIILPNVALMLWCASRGMKQVFLIRQKKTIVIVLIICYFMTNLFRNRAQINFLNDFMGQAGFYLTYVYIPLLFVLTFVIRKVKEKQKG
ncbi:spore germination protein [Metabacillus sp. GX 13764]|uniref:GerAB/ArcD/ProY family transporter n=1 Tax=Metabacillus kandeliae TaxID=2900151 RepID=UPI001E4DCBE2|nr:GerAB/ArcD/ProY family transporter [Metabacillus kandeliae]MCD7036131.1 spore germination protein [Metabacillus kandeliae]